MLELKQRYEMGCEIKLKKQRLYSFTLVGIVKEEQKI